VIVIDASAIIDLLAMGGDRGAWIKHRVGDDGLIQVPELFDLEVLNALRGLEASGARAEVIEAALVGLASLRAKRHAHALFRGRIWALRHNLTAYDAAYVALAEALDAPLITTDGRLARSVGHSAQIELPPV
jgi:predicted nucleic acid-binding protein